MTSPTGSRLAGFLTAAILINVVLGVIANRVSQVFFLDMSGTALAALALGPWGGALVALATNLALSIVPGMDQYLSYLPVNVAGAVIWGTLGRSWLHARPLQRTTSPWGPLLRTWALGFVVGVTCAVIAVMIRVEWRWLVDGAFVAQLPSDHPTEELTRKVAEELVADGTAPSLALVALELLSTVPDKVLSTALALFVLNSFYAGFASDYQDPRRRRASAWPALPWLTSALAVVAWIVLVWRDLFVNVASDQRQIVAWPSLAVVAGAGAAAIRWRRRRTGARNSFAPVYVDWRNLLLDTVWWLGLGYTIFVVTVRHPIIQTETDPLLREGFGVASLLAAIGFVFPFLARRLEPDSPIASAASTAEPEPGATVTGRVVAPRPPQRICVLCGSTPGDNACYEEAARRLGQLLGSRGHTVVYGGTHLGLMDEVACAATEQGAMVLGIVPEPLSELGLARHAHGRVSVVPSFAERLRQMEAMSDAFIVLPGGLGTLEELFAFLAMAQLDLMQKPIGLLNIGGFYDDLLTHLERTARVGFIQREHVSLLIVESEPEPLLERLAAYRHRPIGKWR